jgi:hypothetical protein
MDQETGISSLYDEFPRGYGAEIRRFCPDFRPNSTYKPTSATNHPDEPPMRPRRIALEWGLILTVGTVLALSGFWASSYFINDSLTYLRIPYPPDVRYDLHFSLRGGEICLFDQVEIDGAGHIAPLVVNPRTHIAPPIRGVGHVTIPGLDIQYCQLAPDGYIIWSIRLSLLYPIVVLLLVAVVLGRRLRRRRRGIEAEGPGTATP